MSGYPHQEIEGKWRARWDADGLYRAKVDWQRPKHYALTMLPYPSGDLHIGHWYAMVPSDARARYMRMRGYNVMFPMGFDAFGLPAENAAIQRGIHPWKWTYANIENMRRQLHSMGAMFDWEREAVSCTPQFYRWTEWFFKKFYDSGLAYRAEALVNWSESLQTVLANEQVIDGMDERTGQPVVQKLMSQWFLRILNYADELLDFGKLDWPESVVKAQTNWIGRSIGARVTFRTEQDEPIEIFTTRPDTLWGATFMVLAPEHPLVAEITTSEQRPTIDAYVLQAAQATEIERSSESRDKTGVFTGGYALNPVNDERIPIWIADYVMLTYGTGAIMAVPAHDQRDFEFARQFGIEIRPVIRPVAGELNGTTMAEAYVGPGVMTNSGAIDNVPCNEAKGLNNPSIAATIDWLKKHNAGDEAVTYRLRDWLISRQRYWGAPIPAVRTETGDYESVPEHELPVLLPEDVEFMPTGQSPLQNHKGFLTAQDAEGKPAERETDTMDTFVCSSWYQYRYLSPNYEDGPFDPQEAAYWLPVDVYTGGAEHATLHLLYTRFFTKVMRDLGMFDRTAEVMWSHERNPEALFDEPMLRLCNQGQVLGEEHPGDTIAAYGEWDGNVLRASRVRVLQEADGNGSGDVIGEILRRTENILTVGRLDGSRATVEVAADAELDIPRVAGAKSVNQLHHHLEVERMSKSKGNVVNPDEWVVRFGSDSLRAYLMFGFDWRKGGPWDSSRIQGVVRWINDIWEIATQGPPSGDGTPEAELQLDRRLHQTVGRVQAGLENFTFNTAIAALMAFRNDLRAGLREAHIGAPAWESALNTMVRLMAPLTPHVAEEIWERLGQEYSVHEQPWPRFDATKAAEDNVSLVVLVNGKVRDHVEVQAGIGEDEAKRLGLATEGAQRYLAGGIEPRRVIFIVARKGQEPKVNIVL